MTPAAPTEPGSPERQRSTGPGPAPGTIVMGLVLVTLGAGGALHAATGYTTEPRYTLATLLGAVGSILVLTSVIGLLLDRRSRGRMFHPPGAQRQEGSGAIPASGGCSPPQRPADAYPVARDC